MLRVDAHDAGIVVVTFDAPARLNAFTIPALRAFADLLRALGRDPEVRAVVLTGAGRAFCAGYALEEFEGRVQQGAETEDWYEVQESFADVILAVAAIPKPVIAAINGIASGGGLAIALAADTRLCSESARFHAAFVRLGLSGCDVGVSYHLPRIVGPTRAFEMMLSGRIVAADEALQAGLVLDVVPEGEAVGAAMCVARSIVRNSAFGVSQTKRVMRANLDAPGLAHAVLTENQTQVMCIQTGGFADGLDAVLDTVRSGRA
jgi:enoyl-CoA hydratase